MASTESLPNHRVYLSCHCSTHVMQIEAPADVLGIPADEKSRDSQVKDTKITQGTESEPGLFSLHEGCTCSWCAKRRIAWAFVPTKYLKVVKGMQTATKDGSAQGKMLKEYKFGSKAFSHFFCPDCGTYVLGQRIDWNKPDAPIAVNLRAIRSVNLWNLPIKVHDGKERTPPYTPAPMPAGAQALLDRMNASGKGEYKIWHGSCHCQAVKFAVAVKKDGPEDAIDCDCSICSGNGVLWIYPDAEETVWEPEDRYKATKQYAFGKKTNVHGFCPECGINLFEEDTDASGFGVNAALIDNIDIEKDLKVIQDSAKDQDGVWSPNLE